MIGKLGLVGGVGVAWLLTFVLMGGDVLPALSSADETPGAAASPKASTSLTPTPSPTPSASATPDPQTLAAATAEQLAAAKPLAGKVLKDRPNPRRAAPPVMTFRMASFNALGSSHTRKGTKRKQKASGVARTARAGR